MRPGPAWRGKHLVVKFARIIAGEEFGHEFSLSPPLRRANKKEWANDTPLTSILSLWERRTQVAGVLGIRVGRP